MPRIAIDLTPLKPGGENGGAKLLVRQLLTAFRQLDDSPYNFLLLTAGWNHQELAEFEGPGFELLCVLPDETAPEPSSGVSNYERADQLLYRLRRVLPYAVVRRLLPIAQQVKQKLYLLFKPISPPPASSQILRAHDVDLLFCPFTALTYAEPGIPVISIVYDLQHQAYPQFFDPREVAGREAMLERLCRQTQAIVCISEYTRQTLLAQFSNINPGSTCTVHVCIHTRLAQNNLTSSVLSQLQLHRPYIFYPANFWPHKNHRLLLTAYNIWRRRNPESDLDLVFTGALAQPEQELRSAVKVMGLDDNVHFLGYLPDEQLAAVFQGCQFMIFPSLYEGFGIPLLEAFAFGKPVLCSNVASLPEIGGEAALYFDPRKPVEIVQAIETLLSTPQLASDLIRQGYQQLTRFRPELMVRRYLEIFDHTLRNPYSNTDALTGVFEDGWVGQDLTITYGADNAPRTLTVLLDAPRWLPHRKLTVGYHNQQGAPEQEHWRRGQPLTLQLPLDRQGGYIQLSITPAFRPADYGISNDQRWLSCRCRSCTISYADGSEKNLMLFEQ